MVDLYQLHLQLWNNLNSLTHNGLQVKSHNNQWKWVNQHLQRHLGMRNNSEFILKWLSKHHQLFKLLQLSTQCSVSMVIMLICPNSLMMEVLFKLKSLKDHHSTQLKFKLNLQIKLSSRRKWELQTIWTHWSDCAFWQYII